MPTDGSADNQDSDVDGFNNWQEWRAGTNPTNAALFLQVASGTTSYYDTTAKSSILYFYRVGVQ